jgi:hypothetical protein
MFMPQRWLRWAGTSGGLPVWGAWRFFAARPVAALWSLALLMRWAIRLVKWVMLGVLSAGSLGGCGYVSYLIPLNPMSASATPVNHAPWDALLKKYVDAAGMVDYRGFQQDSTALNDYLQQLATHLPSPAWSELERLAYWLNAYNAFTIQRVLRDYPIRSIRELGGEQTLLNTVWDQPFIVLGAEYYSLNDLEHRLIRRQFADNRIHFALVCAARSCPRLRNEAYTAAELNEQLEAQAWEFINNPSKNNLTPPEAPAVSAIFDFYPGDFTKNGSSSVPELINRYAEQPIDVEAPLTYLAYDWALNEQ